MCFLSFVLKVSGKYLSNSSFPDICEASFKRYYTASAPGEPPAVRTGMLRMSWGMKAEGDGKGNYTAGIYTDVPYAEDLDTGTPGGKIKPRPYKDKIIETAKPKVVSVFAELETK